MTYPVHRIKKSWLKLHYLFNCCFRVCLLFLFYFKTKIKLTTLFIQNSQFVFKMILQWILTNSNLRNNFASSNVILLLVTSGALHSYFPVVTSHTKNKAKVSSFILLPLTCANNTPHLAYSHIVIWHIFIWPIHSSLNRKRGIKPKSQRATGPLLFDLVILCLHVTVCSLHVHTVQTRYIWNGIVSNDLHFDTHVVLSFLYLLQAPYKC